MNQPPQNLTPLGDFKPSDIWATHINSIFYGIKGPQIHNHFQTYVSLDYRLAHALANDFFNNAKNRQPEKGVWYVQEWGVGNGNLAACFLSHLREIDIENQVYPSVHYILCDESEEILKGVRANTRLQEHAGNFSTVRIHAEHLNCFRANSVSKIISNEIWDDLATRVLLKHQGLYYEEFLCPFLDLETLPVDKNEFLEAFSCKDLAKLAQLPPFLDMIHWERDFQRVNLEDWPFAEILKNHAEEFKDEIPMPVNTGAFSTISKAKELLTPNNFGYTSFDYGMESMQDLNQEGRPYFNLYGGQYTFMVNFPLLENMGRSIGFNKITREYQNQFVQKDLESAAISLVDLMQNHPRVAEMPPWDRDILMLSTLHALNSVYRSPYQGKLDYPVMQGTPKKQRKQIAQLTKNLSSRGVPDTVAYVTREEVQGAMKPLRKLGYRERDIESAFNSPPPPVSFVHIQFS
jgi:SAM-dependent MidA family methyltransferase